MSAPTMEGSLLTVTAAVTVSDLIIEEFSNWCNSNNAQLSPTTSCWCRADLTTDR